MHVAFCLELPNDFILACLVLHKVEPKFVSNAEQNIDRSWPLYCYMAPFKKVYVECPYFFSRVYVNRILEVYNCKIQIHLGSIITSAIGRSFVTLSL